VPKTSNRKAAHVTREAAPPPVPASGRRAILVGAGLAALILGVFGSVSGFEFVNYDDPDYVTANPHIGGGLTWPAIRWAFTAGYAANWHPLTWLSHMADIELFGLNAGPHHAVNVLLHIVSTVLLFGVLRSSTGSTWRSAFVAALFAVHPLHVESVAWVAERKDVLSTVFWMLTLWAYVWYARAPSRSRYAVVAACLALGLMAKPMLVSLPLVLLLVDVWPLRRVTIGKDPSAAWVKLIVEKVPLLVLAAASSAVTLLVQRQGTAVMRLDQVPLSIRVPNAVTSYAGYILKMLWPVDLVAMYPLPLSPPRPELVIAALLVLGGITFAVVRTARQHPVMLVGWLWYVVTLVPVIGLVQVGGQAMADRYTYVPLVGLFIMVAWGASEALARWPGRVPALASAAVLSIAVCAFLARRQTQLWKDSRTLWSHAVRTSPDNYFAHGSLGYVFWSDGEVEEAVEHYTEALRLRPGYAEGHNNMGVALAAKGRLREAVPHFIEAVRLRPSFASAQENLRATEERLRSLDAELARFANDVQSRPEDMMARNEYGAALAAQGRVDEAAEQFAAAARIDPTQPDVQYNLGMMLSRLGKTAPATEAFEAALRLNPQHEAARQALRELTERVPTP
jgi:Tfp pilus assembly protein PilF